jgi:hypothetical protein
MSQSIAVTRSFEGYDRSSHAVRIADDAGSKVVRFPDHARDQGPGRASPLVRYLEGWAEANLGKILDATAPGYRFRDPFVGTFSRGSLRRYFDLLRARLCLTGAVRRLDIAFFLRGPMDRSSCLNGLQFWREAPRVGLTGISQIVVGERGVIAEGVAYDLNEASGMLCRGFSEVVE